MLRFDTAAAPGAGGLVAGHKLLLDKAKYWTNLHYNLKSFMLGGVLHVLWTTESSLNCQVVRPHSGGE